MPILSVLQGPDKGREFSVSGGETVLIGRASGQVPVSDFTVSRRHAQIRRGQGEWLLDDLNSANGTYLNGKRVERPVRLKHGDQIRMGGTVLSWGGRDEPGRDGRGTSVSATSDLIDLDEDDRHGEAAIIGTVASADDSMILASPAAAEAVRAWRVLSSLLEAVGAVLSPQELLDRVMDILFEEVPAEHGLILMQTPGKDTYEPAVVRYREADQKRIRTSRRIVDHVIKRREGVLCSNAMSDERFGGTQRDGSIARLGLQSVICAPILSRDEVLGVIHLDCAISTHIYSEEQLRLVTVIGRMAALAVENARLVGERMRMERLTAVGETVAALSHHIKNILQGMMGGSDVVEMGLSKESLPLVDQGWQIVRPNLDRILSLTMNMLAFAKKREPRLEEAQLNAVVTDVLELVKRRAEDKGVLIRSELEEPMPAVPMDVDGIHQVVMNIVVNALDAAPKSTGVVTVKTALDADRGRVILTVGDNGPGIPEDARDRVFDAFYSTKGHGGTGLGLAVARKIIGEHYGHIELTSIPNEGTLIRVSLPPAQPTGMDSAATHGPAPT